MDFEKFLEKTGVHLGLATLFTLIYGTGILVISPLLTTLLGGFNGVLIGHALFTSILGVLYVKLLRGKSFKEKISGSIIGTVIISIFSSYHKIQFESLKTLTESFSQTQNNLPNSQNLSNLSANTESMIDPVTFFTIQIIFFNLPFIYTIKKNQEIPELNTKEKLTLTAYLIPIITYYTIPAIYGAR